MITRKEIIENEYKYIIDEEKIKEIIDLAQNLNAMNVQKK